VIRSAFKKKKGKKKARKAAASSSSTRGNAANSRSRSSLQVSSGCMAKRFRDESRGFPGPGGAGAGLF